ncbi:YggS family pyridoxal phosphate-dependent enzyme [Sediminispirochaeta bajacaliforniensis]|uniref:YggS family pyridoxal phosphate-dependent enzyme n=1 Tax=Sediminispirochaeta bajacaliforniensis TaxID=148 RepID=UPI00039A76F2|nr:YggS family pyridoxal phosphate-dependent enzyme [Sediminispirochaeta bajacaliforniensis]
MEGMDGMIAGNIARIRDEIAEAAHKAGRDPGDIQLMAVTKTHPFEDVLAAYEAGIRLFGENRVQEAVGKYTVPLPADMGLHMIGHLQSNKVKQIVPLVQCVESIDKVATAEELNKRAQAAGKHIDIMFEVNTSGEVSKNGFSEYEELSDALGATLELDALCVTGLMTIGPLGGDEGQIRKAFILLRSMSDRLSVEYPQAKLRELSMGMSGDFPIAVAEGATIVRVGTAIFGRRD